MKYTTKTMVGLIVLVVFCAPAVNAIKLNVISDDVSVTSDYDLADSTSLQEETMIMDSGVAVNRQASGSDSNKLKQHIRGSNYKIDNAFSTTGNFGSSTTATAAANAAVVSQDLSSNGNIDAGLMGSTFESTAGQQASVTGGVMQSSQSLMVAGGVLAGQKTEMDGAAGSMNSIAESEGTPMVVSAQFDGDGGDLDARILSLASKGPHMQGTTNVNGLEFLNNEILRCLESGDVSMSVEGLYSTSSGELGRINLMGTTSVGSTAPLGDAPLGDSSSYSLLGGMINTYKPIQLYLRSDSNLRSEGLDPTVVSQAIAAAANTWDEGTMPGQNNLFKPGVIIDSYKPADKKDGYSTHAFASASDSYIAYARTWYSKDFKYIVETDVVYNTKWAWTTDFAVSQSTNGKTRDVQTIALHELGHASGLSDYRGTDYNQIMSGYHGPQHVLGAGDLAGLQKIYGA